MKALDDYIRYLYGGLYMIFDSSPSILHMLLIMVRSLDGISLHPYLPALSLNLKVS